MYHHFLLGIYFISLSVGQPLQAENGFPSFMVSMTNLE